ncbi:cellulose synthase complex periplasmic endoglucanase BcsZ [Chitinasiproducens palmae]|uniref:cellulase n=1 Tax=Chitinasiproducens palmae TaxID=1770053 RepID=A0A1H2PMN7_9BURK|nr:cellulose synthase complex periplasmic endoglucanase BcsZ [Chitinasiproducens palmae]SDV47840.1 endoglucanase [Chitinasiproducens palmae]
MKKPFSRSTLTRRPLHRWLLGAALFAASSAGANGALAAAAAEPANATDAAAAANSRHAAQLAQAAAPAQSGDPSAVRAGAGSSRAPVPGGRCNWPDYSAFLGRHVQADGRVIDYGPPQQTTSEGQSYALFFALVDNDRATFDRLLAWTEANLGSGDMAARLPAWQWGQRKDGSWGIMDQNSASDADLWIAYALFEAGRLWRQPRYTTLALAIVDQVKSTELFSLPSFGPMLAPGQTGFRIANDVWRLNPSYVPLPVLRLIARNDPQGPWKTIASNTVAMMRAVAPRGYAPDWAAYQSGKGFIIDPVKGDVGSYDAIRTYLWAGMTPKSDPLAAPLLAALGGMRAAAGGAVPEKVATVTGTTSGTGPAGFSAALLPYYMALGANGQLNAARARAADASGAASQAPGYYDRVLQLFGQGYADGRYRFDASGRLLPNWSASCRG